MRIHTPMQPAAAVANARQFLGLWRHYARLAVQGVWVEIPCALVAHIYWLQAASYGEIVAFPDADMVIQSPYAATYLVSQEGVACLWYVAEHLFDWACPVPPGPPAPPSPRPRARSPRVTPAPEDPGVAVLPPTPVAIYLRRDRSRADIRAYWRQQHKALLRDYQAIPGPLPLVPQRMRDPVIPDPVVPVAKPPAKKKPARKNKGARPPPAATVGDDIDKLLDECACAIDPIPDLPIPVHCKSPSSMPIRDEWPAEPVRDQHIRVGALVCAYVGDRQDRVGDVLDHWKQKGCPWAHTLLQGGALADADPTSAYACGQALRTVRSLLPPHQRGDCPDRIAVVFYGSRAFEPVVQSLIRTLEGMSTPSCRITATVENSSIDAIRAYYPMAPQVYAAIRRKTTPITILLAAHQKWLAHECDVVMFRQSGSCDSSTSVRETRAAFQACGLDTLHIAALPTAHIDARNPAYYEPETHALPRFLAGGTRRRHLALPRLACVQPRPLAERGAIVYANDIVGRDEFHHESLASVAYTMHAIDSLALCIRATAGGAFMCNPSVAFASAFNTAVDMLGMAILDAHISYQAWLGWAGYAFSAMVITPPLPGRDTGENQRTELPAARAAIESINAYASTPSIVDFMAQHCTMLTAIARACMRTNVLALCPAPPYDMLAVTSMGPAMRAIGMHDALRICAEVWLQVVALYTLGLRDAPQVFALMQQQVPLVDGNNEAERTIVRQYRPRIASLQMLAYYAREIYRLHELPDAACSGAWASLARDVARRMDRSGASAHARYVFYASELLCDPTSGLAHLARYLTVDDGPGDMRYPRPSRPAIEIVSYIDHAATHYARIIIERMRPVASEV